MKYLSVYIKKEKEFSYEFFTSQKHPNKRYRLYDWSLNHKNIHIYIYMVGSNTWEHDHWIKPLEMSHYKLFKSGPDPGYFSHYACWSG